MKTRLETNSTITMIKNILASFLLCTATLSAQDFILKVSPAAFLNKQSAHQSIRALIQENSSSLKIESIEAVANNAEGTPLQHVYAVQIQGLSDQSSFLKKLHKNQFVEYIQLNHVFHIEQNTVNDSLFDQQWALSAVHAVEAWEIETGREDILLAVIDTGIDYRHPDLTGQLWLNKGEDINKNGLIDSIDFNGIDDDGNGFIDDIRGWDFTDAPRFIDSGDYAEPDNDPADEHGHGTMVSGIIAAKTNNRIGVAGLAHGCQVMNLRAGTSLGYLEEDDVAAAIVYAVKNGARVINMSFGDSIVSPMLRDVIRYAYENDVILVASSGNSATDLPHYPSGFAETIAVGATQESGSIAGFSNFGATLDIVAPGLNVWTTNKNSAYTLFNGTSAAAPFVTALAGLLLSHDTNLDNEMVRHLIISSAEDLGEEGWDPYFAAGQINCAAALTIKDAPIAELLQPHMDSGSAMRSLPIIGTASAQRIDNFVLSYGVGDNPSSWTEITNRANKIIIEDTLFTWDSTTLADTTYMLRLLVTDKTGTVVEDKSRVFIDHTPPVVSQISAQPMVDGNHRCVLLTLATDDVCTATLYWRRSSTATEFEQVQLNYETRFHQFNFSEFFSNGEPVEVFFQLKNKAGLRTTVDNNSLYYPISFEPVPVNTWQFEKNQTKVGAGLLLPRLTDLDGDGNAEVITSEYDERGNIGATIVYEWQPEMEFVSQFSTNGLAIPRDAGDTDKDGLQELLLGAGPKSSIYEMTSTDAWELQSVWENEDSFWAACFSDLDGDGRQEIVARVDDEWQVWEYTDSRKFVFVASLPNPTDGGNASGVPHAEIADFDGDGRQEILFGDYDGDVFIYENSGDNQFTSSWSAKQPLLDSGDFITTGDFNNDGRQDFAVATHSDPGASNESQFDSRHWITRIYSAKGDNDFSVLWEEHFFGFYPVKDFDSGIGSGDLDADGGDELLLSFFPNAYVVKYVPEDDDFHILWHTNGAKSNRIFTGDKGDGTISLFLNDSEHLLEFKPLQAQSTLVPPRYLQVAMQQNGLIKLDWPEAANAEFYRIYRSTSTDSLTQFIDVLLPPFIDSTASADTVYYRIASGSVQRDSVISHPTSATRVIRGEQPGILAVNFFHPGFISVFFSHKMNEAANQVNNYNLEAIGPPQSVTLASENREAILAFPALSPGAYKLHTAHLQAQNGMPLIEAEAGYSVDVTTQPKTLYLSSGYQQLNKSIVVQFNVPVDEQAAISQTNYRISPALKIENISMNGDQQVMFNLEGTTANADSTLIQIIAENITGKNGEKLRRGVGDRLQIPYSFAQEENAAVYPNPFIRSVHTHLKMANLKANSTVHVYNVRGQLVFKTMLPTNATAYSWDVLSNSKKRLSSGVYFVQITTGSGKKKVKKIAVLN
ncbi:MAG: S8 family serine peptidase [Deferribacteres bacterium]|nr:S8 family serine peptidase [Deferribacteres bacterium]